MREVYQLDNISDRYRSQSVQVRHGAEDAVLDHTILRLWCHAPNAADDYDRTGDALQPAPPDEAGDTWATGKEIGIPRAMTYQMQGTTWARLRRHHE
jgi:hypothetical protein